MRPTAGSQRTVMRPDWQDTPSHEHIIAVLLHDSTAQRERSWTKSGTPPGREESRTKSKRKKTGATGPTTGSGVGRRSLGLGPRRVWNEGSQEREELREPGADLSAEELGRSCGGALHETRDGGRGGEPSAKAELRPREEAVQGRAGLGSRTRPREETVQGRAGLGSRMRPRKARHLQEADEGQGRLDSQMRPRGARQPLGRSRRRRELGRREKLREMEEGGKLRWAKLGDGRRPRPRGAR